MKTFLLAACALLVGCVDIDIHVYVGGGLNVNVTTEKTVGVKAGDVDLEARGGGLF